jgi:hypothetical protein
VKIIINLDVFSTPENTAIVTDAAKRFHGHFLSLYLSFPFPSKFTENVYKSEWKIVKMEVASYYDSKAFDHLILFLSLFLSLEEPLSPWQRNRISTGVM